MRLATIKLHGAEIAGIVTGKGILPVAALNAYKGTGWKEDMMSLIQANHIPGLTKWYNEGGKEELESIPGLVPTEEVVYAPLYRNPKRIFGIGLNYACLLYTSIGAVYTSVLSGVALKSSGLTYIHDLLGKRVAVGPAASATENATLAAFGVMGIDSSNTSLENLGLGDGADSVGDGILDAAFGFAGLPIGGQLNLAATKEIQVLDMTQEEIDKVLAGNAAYIQTKIPAGTYTGQDNDANTFGVKCLIIVTADMDADLVYDLCKAMNEHTEEMAAGNALLKDMTDPSFLCTQMPIPLHDGAQKYYSEQGLI